jgi:hypothetical protein
LPEKLPVACPSRTAEFIGESTQRIKKTSILWDFASAEPSKDLGHFTAIIAQFIVKPLSTNRMRWLLHRLRCSGFVGILRGAGGFQLLAHPRGLLATGEKQNKAEQLETR